MQFRNHCIYKQREKEGYRSLKEHVNQIFEKRTIGKQKIILDQTRDTFSLPYGV